MSARAVGISCIALACACEAVSGLSSLQVGDGASPADVTSDTASDVTKLPDTGGPPLEAGSGGYALGASGGCATGTNVPLSNIQFTITLWLRVDMPSSNSILPIVWSGGRAPSEPGWSLDLTSTGVIFCVADQNGATCTPSYAIVPGHLVHLGIVSPYNGQTSGRSMTVYAMDRSAGASTHTQVATVAGAQGNWSSTTPITIGGAAIGPTCTSPSNVTVDRLHFVGGLVSVQVLDTTASSSSCSVGVAADYEFDENTGTSTKSCAAAGTLSWANDSSAKIGFVVSPFP
jgi:hypothetical protein